MLIVRIMLDLHLLLRCGVCNRLLCTVVNTLWVVHTSPYFAA